MRLQGDRKTAIITGSNQWYGKARNCTFCQREGASIIWVSRDELRGRIREDLIQQGRKGKFLLLEHISQIAHELKRSSLSRGIYFGNWISDGDPYLPQERDTSYAAITVAERELISPVEKMRLCERLLLPEGKRGLSAMVACCTASFTVSRLRRSLRCSKINLSRDITCSRDHTLRLQSFRLFLPHAYLRALSSEHRQRFS